MDLITIGFALISASCVFACVVLWMDRRDIQSFAAEATATKSMRERLEDLEARVGAVRLDATALAGELERVDQALKSHVQRANAYRSADKREEMRERLFAELAETGQQEEHAHQNETSVAHQLIRDRQNGYANNAIPATVNGAR